jgi:endonuclease YncB( thermonuclease family)
LEITLYLQEVNDLREIRRDANGVFLKRMESIVWKKFILASILFVAASGCRFEPPQDQNSRREAPQNSPAAAPSATRKNEDRSMIAGRVVHISDGDTFIIEKESGERVTVRIHAVDAPELSQEFGRESRENLRALIDNQQVEIRQQTTDPFHRIVGQGFLNGRDIGLEQVAGGFAWHFKQYAKQQPQNERKTYADAEETARNNHRGLWQSGQAENPQNYRRTHGTYGGTRR